MRAMDIHNSSDEWRIVYHFVWSPMRAKPCLVGEIARRLQDLIEERRGDMDFEPVTLVILPDRVYLAAAAPPNLAPHSIGVQVKALPPRGLRGEFPHVTRSPSIWTRLILVVAGSSIEQA